MSLVFEDTAVDVVKCVFTKKSGGTSTYYFGTDYYAPNELYSGSPEVWPVLVEAPVAELGFSKIGNTVAERANPSFRVFAHNPLDRIDITFYSLWATHDQIESEVTYLWYCKPRAAATTNGANNIWQSRLKIINVTFDSQDGGGGDVATVTCRDEWYKNKLLGRRMTDSDFGSLEDGYNGEFGPIPLGNNVIIPAPFVGSDTTSSPVKGQVFLGWESANLQVHSVNAWYARNQNRTVDKREWVNFAWAPYYDIPWGGVAGPYSSYSNHSLTTHARGLINGAATNAVAIHLVNCYVAPQGSVNKTLGQLLLSIWSAERLGDSASFAPRGGALRVSQKDVEAATVQVGTDQCSFQIESPLLVTTQAGLYMFILDWTGEDTSNYLYTKAFSSGTDHYYFDKSTNRPPLLAASNQTLAMAIYAVGTGNGKENAQSSIANSWAYCHYDLSAKGALLHTGQTRARIDTDLELRADVNGLKDVAGTYTGSAGAVVSNPADILQMVLRDSTLFMGVDSGDIDTTSFTSVRAKAGAIGLKVNYPLYTDTGEGFIVKTCEQFLLHFHKERDGDLTLSYLTGPGTPTNIVSEAKLRGDMTVTRYNGGDPNDVFNAFNVEWNPNRKDADLINTTETVGLGKFEGREYLDSVNDSGFSQSLKDLISASNSKYGTREFGLRSFDMHETEGSVSKTITRRAQLHHEPPKTVVVRLPRKDFEDVAIFDTFRVESFDLPVDGGPSDDVRLHDDGDTLYMYDEGIRLHTTRQGTLDGRVIYMAATGYWVDLLISTTGAI